MIDFLSVTPSEQDFHMHTTFCDGKNSPEDMVLGAIEKGLKRVGARHIQSSQWQAFQCQH